MSTIIAKIHGGLGNQLFQYAYAKELALRYKSTLKLDISGYDPKKASATSPDILFNRGLGLYQMNVTEDIASAAEIDQFRCKNSKLWRLILRVFPTRFKYVEERQFHFGPQYSRPAALEKGRSVYVHGYWQSEKYFYSIREEIRRLYKVRTAPDAQNESYANAIAATDSVALHVRRGNFLLKHYRDYHGVCGLSYYEAAVKIIQEKVKSPHFFIFTDDVDWVKANLRLSAPMTYIEGNGAAKDFEDIRLMSLCSHHIVANSSFSWWGAWLGGNPNKTIVVPDTIFKCGDFDTRDFAPESWIKVNTQLE